MDQSDPASNNVFMQQDSCMKEMANLVCLVALAANLSFSVSPYAKIIPDHA